MRRLACVLVLAACTPPRPMAAPAPIELAVTIPPAVVVQRAAQRLTMDGFTIAASDATGGILTATLVRRGSGTWGPFIACTLADNSIGHQNGAATLTVRVTAQATATGSKVFAGSSTTTAIAMGSMSSTDDTYCASTGLAEQHIAESITTP